MNIGKKVVNDLVHSLEYATEAARMETCTFDNPAKTKMIQDETRLYRQTYIIDRLERVIKVLKELP